ncbi:MAG: hypothetical protein ABIA93_03845 [Candidatus Woesearchaeota archaeon]
MTMLRELRDGYNLGRLATEHDWTVMQGRAGLSRGVLTNPIDRDIFVDMRVVEARKIDCKYASLGRVGKAAYWTTRTISDCIPF